MLKTFNVLRIILLSFAIVSCQKDINQPTSSAADITGTWTLVSFDVNITAVQQVTEGADEIKTVSVNNYITKTNSGTITFDATKITANNLSYSVDAVAKSSVYENGALIDTFSAPFQFKYPAYNGVTAYKTITADSLYFESGTLFMSGVTQNTQPGGIKFKLENDKLYLTQSVLQSTRETDQGAAIISTVDGKMIMTLKR